jgi:hypothetical protein
MYIFLEFLKLFLLFVSIVHIDPRVKFFLKEIALDILDLVDIAVKGQKVAEGAPLEILFQCFLERNDTYLHVVNPFWLVYVL